MLIDPYTWHSVKILRKIAQSPDAATIVTTRPAGYSFVPGQHTIVRASIADQSRALRQYSFSHIPDIDELHFTVTRSPGGAVSNWLIDKASTGITFDISQAFAGPLVFSPQKGDKIGFIAGGSGIAPVMSHVRSLRAHFPDIPYSVIYSTRESSRCFTDELQPLSALEQVAVYVTDTSARVSRDEIMQKMQGTAIILICGSRPFVKDMLEICKAAYPDTAIHAEAFSL